jgi:hypothetical protein
MDESHAIDPSYAGAPRAGNLIVRRHFVLFVPIGQPRLDLFHDIGLHRLLKRSDNGDCVREREIEAYVTRNALPGDGLGGGSHPSSS